MTQNLKALIVEDNPNDADLLLLELEDGGFKIESQVVDTPQAYQSALEKDTWDVIFSDHTMPNFNSFEALEIRNRKGLDVPFIILSGTIGEELAVQAMKSGASDYFVKGKLTRLNAALNRELQEFEERKTKRKVEQELEHFIESLTHDLRTPILAEYRVLEQLKSGALGPLSEEQLEIIAELIHSNHFTQHMINNILYAYKYKQRNIRLDKESTELVSFLNSIKASLAEQTFLSEKNQRLSIHATGVIPPVNIDKIEIERALLNLIKNAGDFSPQHSEIKISVSLQGSCVRVAIEDMGPGVAPEIEPHLFTLYTTATSKKFRQVGMGLGLYLTKQIIETHGGKVGYQKMDHGSLFYFDLPAEP